MFSFELYEISKNTFFYRTHPVAASRLHNIVWRNETHYNNTNFWEMKN